MLEVDKHLTEISNMYFPKEPLNPIGTCFDSAAHQLILGGLENNPDGTYLCHGIGIATLPGQEGWTIGHAWLEFPHPKHGIIAIDTTWGEMIKADKYREDLKVSYVVTYSPQEALDLWRQFDMPGPWDAKIKAITDRKKENDNTESRIFSGSRAKRDETKGSK